MTGTQLQSRLELLLVDFKLDGLTMYLSWSHQITGALVRRCIDDILTCEEKEPPVASLRLIHPFNFKFSDYFSAQIFCFNIKILSGTGGIEDNSLEVTIALVIAILFPRLRSSFRRLT